MMHNTLDNTPLLTLKLSKVWAFEISLTRKEYRYRKFKLSRFLWPEKDTVDSRYRKIIFELSKAFWNFLFTMRRAKGRVHLSDKIMYLWNSPEIHTYLLGLRNMFFLRTKILKIENFQNLNDVFLFHLYNALDFK